MKLKAPEGATSCSFEGEEFAVDKNGLVDVPDHAVALLDHGYEIPGAKRAAADTKSATVAQLNSQLEDASNALSAANEQVTTLKEELTAANDKLVQAEAIFDEQNTTIATAAKEVVALKEELAKRPAAKK